jgi:hypothetical protein
MTVTEIQLPAGFTAEYEQAVISYLAGTLHGRKVWQTAFAAYDLLDRAMLVMPEGHYSFRALYQEIVDRQMADSYLRELLALDYVREDSPALWSSYARQIVTICQQRGWQEAALPGARVLQSYLLYWWGAFARGYAFEVEVFRDLRNSGVEFQAHDLLDRQERYSPSDLIVSGMTGDIKTSVYFVQVATPLQHDFYIVRLFVQGQSYTLAVMLQSSAWEEINGDTILGTLGTLVTGFPYPVRIKQGVHELVALRYDEWKRRILRLQGEI